MFSDGYYYLIGENGYQLVSYRIDRMSNLELDGKWDLYGRYECLADDISCFEGKFFLRKEGFSKYAEFRSGTLGGFTWEAQDGVRCRSNYINVVLKVKGEFIGDIYDKFGKDIRFYNDGDGSGGWYTAQVRMLNAESSFSWFVKFGDKIKILSPDSLIQDYKDYLNGILKSYN